MTIKARYISYKNTENHGDEALMWILRDLLAPEIEVVFEPGKYDIALLGGGTLINQSPWLLDFFADVRKQCKAGFVLGAGVGNPDFWGNQFPRWNEWLEQCDFVGVRGPYSLDLLKKNGFSRAVVTGDPYLVLQSPMPPRPQARRLAINLGSTNDSLWGGSDAELCGCVAEMAARLQRKGWSFVWYSVCDKDLRLLESCRERLTQNPGPLVDVRRNSLEAYSLLSTCNVVLAEKLHACAMATVAGVPFVGLEYQPKVRDFAASVSMDAYLLPTSERDPGRLCDAIEGLGAKREQCITSMISARDKLRSKFFEAVGKIRKMAAEMQKGEA